MSFLGRVARLSLRDRLKSSAIREELGVEPPLLRNKTSQLRWFGPLIRMLCGRLPGEVFRAHPTGRRPREDPGHPGSLWMSMSLGWPGSASGSHQKSWVKWLGRGRSGLPCLGCGPHDLTPDKWWRMNE